MNPGQESPDYTLVVIYDNNKTDQQRKIDDQPVNSIEFIVKWLSKFTNEQMCGTPLHISYFTNRGVRGNKYTACIPKKLNDYFSTDEGKAHLKSSELNIVRYSVRRNGKHQKIYGLYIPGPEEVIRTIFTNLENGFVRPNSYKIIRPPSDENGNIRDYNIITFEKNHKGVIPRQFVEKLKVLIEDTVFNDKTIRVKWLNRKVYDDITNGVNKKINVGTSTPMEL